MVNLQAQYQRFQPEMNAAFARVCQSGAFIKGSEVADFERELANIIKCQACNRRCQWYRRPSNCLDGP